MVLISFESGVQQQLRREYKNVFLRSGKKIWRPNPFVGNIYFVTLFVRYSHGLDGWAKYKYTLDRVSFCVAALQLYG